MRVVCRAQRGTSKRICQQLALRGEVYVLFHFVSKSREGIFVRFCPWKKWLFLSLSKCLLVFFLDVDVCKTPLIYVHSNQYVCVWKIVQPPQRYWSVFVRLDWFVRVGCADMHVRKKTKHFTDIFAAFCSVGKKRTQHNLFSISAALRRIWKNSAYCCLFAKGDVFVCVTERNTSRAIFSLCAQAWIVCGCLKYLLTHTPELVYELAGGVSSFFLIVVITMPRRWLAAKLTVFFDAVSSNVVCKMTFYRCFSCSELSFCRRLARIFVWKMDENCHLFSWMLRKMFADVNVTCA